MSYQCPHCGETVREPYAYHERGDCEAAKAGGVDGEGREWREALWLAALVVAFALTALALTLVACAGIAIAAPAPGRVPAALPAPARAVTEKELQAVRTLVWGEKVWQIGFQADGTYWCHRLEDGRGILWSGPYRLVDGTVVIEESSALVAPDAPPEAPAGPYERVLEVKVKAGKITGTGWGGPLVLE